jgi:hypothetical protein
MTFFQIYFIIAAAILLSKFFYGVFTLKRLKTFADAKRNLINKQFIDNPLFSYSDLFIYHFSTNSIKDESYEKEMTDFLTKEGTNSEIIIYIIFALTWVISVPCVLLCMLIRWLKEMFEKFAKSILS